MKFLIFIGLKIVEIGTIVLLFRGTGWFFEKRLEWILLVLIGIGLLIMFVILNWSLAGNILKKWRNK